MSAGLIKRRPDRAFAPLGVLLLSACSYQPTIQHPKLAEITASEATMDCRRIDHAIDQADTVRWVIRDDGGHLESSGRKVARYAGNILMTPFLLHSGGAYLSDGGQAALNAADRRIVQLLQLKRGHSCPARATALAGVDDLSLLGQVEPLIGRGDADAERTRLLDALRDMQVPVN
ncbi:MAG: hypothetical protein WCE48_01555 [Steroidobacteraceae bacterium]